MMNSAVPSAHRLSSVKGFTLMEVVITAAVVSTGALAIMGVLSSGLSSSRAGLQGAQAAVVARGVLQDLETGGLVDPPAMGDERLTVEMRPNGTLNFGRQVFLMDAAGIPLRRQPGAGQAESTYERGDNDPDAFWLVSVEGIAKPEKWITGGEGQVLEGVELKTYNALTTKSTSSAASNNQNNGNGNSGENEQAFEPPPVLAPTQVTVLVECPATAPRAGRQRYRFVQLWNR